MKTIRIGVGSGGCSYERMEPAIELAEKGDIDYLVFECLSERTMSDAQREKMADPSRGYNAMLQERMTRFLPLMASHGFKIVSNMGGANTPAAVDEIARIARDLGVHAKIAMVSGDDILADAERYRDVALFRGEGTLGDLPNLLSANVYLGADSIRRALDEGADIVITGRVADVSLFMGPMLHEFGWTPQDRDKVGQGLLLGHLMECCGQLTGGYYADPGYKDVPDLHRLGHPIAEIGEDGSLAFTKVEGSGGLICTDICKEQMLYEIGSPSRYLTPDGIADFSHVTFEQDGPNRVIARGATSSPATETYKANVGYLDSYIGVGEISFGGSTSLARAQLCADIVQKRWELLGLEPSEKRIDYIGYNSLFKDHISEHVHPGGFSEIRLRIAVRAATEQAANVLIREMKCLYINGPAGGSGIRTRVEPSVSMAAILVPRSEVGTGSVSMREV